MKSKHYQALGIGLFSSLVLLTPQVMADETTPVTATTSTEAVVASESSTSTEVTTNYTDDSQLNQAISEATTEGITAVETETETFESTQEAQANYAEQSEMVKEVTKDYQEAKATYQKAEQDYQNYQKQEQVYQDELVKYQEYEKKVQQYNVAQKTYNLAKARYDEDYNTALGNTNKTGYLPEVLAQNLIFRSEPNATQTFTGNIIPDEILETVIKDSHGWMDPGTVTAYAPGQTVTTTGRWNTALMDIGDTVVVEYSGLENSSFSGYQLKKVRYTYRLIDTTHYSGKVIFQAIDDPTVTSYTHIYNKDGVTQSSFEMEMTVQFFDANGKEIIPTEENYALTSFASINSRNGEGEFVGNYSGRFIPINGSTITVQDNYALNYSDVSQESLSDSWDSDTSPDAYIGAIVGKSTERIRFQFGNSHGFADWFAFNSDVKVKGGILNPPTPPTAPAFMAKPVAPKKVEQPHAILTPILLYHRNKVVPKPAETQKQTNVPKSVAQPVSQQVTVTPTYQPQTVHTVPRVYTYARPNFGRGQVITRTATPTYTVTLPTTTVTPAQPSTTTNPSAGNQTPKKNQTSQKTDWFGQNTGIVDSKETGKAQTDLKQFIKDIGQKAKKKYGNDFNKINRDIALTLASPTYEKDKLQNLYNTFKNSTYKIPDNVRDTIVQNHKTGNIDFSHVMTTLASLEDQKVADELIKHTASRSMLFTTNNQRNIILEQNSLLGDLLTTMPESDIYTDMDAIILARHPKYKNLPLDERILAYYNQENLDDKRKDLFLEVYGMNQGKDKGEAQLASFMEIVASFLTVGGIGTLVYSVGKKKHQNIGNNIQQLDTVLYDGNLDKFRKHPLKTASATIAKTVEKKVVKPIAKTVQKINNKVIKPVVQTVKKTTAKVVKATKTFVTKTVPKAAKKVVKKVMTTAKKAVAMVKKVTPQPVKKVVKKISQPVKKVVKKVVQPVKRVVRRVVQPVKKVIKRAAPVIKKVVRTVKKAVTPKKKSSKKRRR